MFARILAGGLFSLAGLALLAVNTGNNVVEITRTGWAWDTVAVLVGLALTSALLSLSLAAVWRKSKASAVIGALIIAGCMVTSVTLTVDRIGGVLDDSKQVSRNINGKILRAKAAIKSLSDRIQVQREIEAVECKGYVEGVSNASGWPRCTKAKGLIAAYQDELDTVRRERATLGEIVTVESHSERFLAWVAGPKAGVASEMVRPVITALSLEFGTSLLLSIAGMFFASGPRRVNFERPIRDITPSQSKLQEATVVIRRLAERRGGELPALREVVKIAPDISRTTAWRAIKLLERSY